MIGTKFTKKNKKQLIPVHTMLWIWYHFIVTTNTVCKKKSCSVHEPAVQAAALPVWGLICYKYTQQLSNQYIGYQLKQAAGLQIWLQQPTPCQDYSVFLY